MKEELERHCDRGLDRFACPDALVAHSPKFDEFGIIVHDGGVSTVQIMFCPWCGAKLPESKRDRWFEELEAKGIDPASDDAPEEYQTSAWWIGRPT
jgi:hypothetical protein